jgi:hypothetical protein
MTNELTWINRNVLTPALALLPPAMDSKEARALILAICLQESRFQHRVQLLGPSRHWWQSLNGPARGFAQFEKIGVRGVLEHRASRDLALTLLANLRYPDDPVRTHEAMAHNDMLMFAFSRLALRRYPGALPTRGDADEAWRQYVAIWAPGKPHSHTWDAFYHMAWEAVCAKATF